ncbi:hypothetical protein F4604DRAFT_1674567 [Suillus subluteus]|nr:hypothetical protein F4604DRAFT_1674567 [Suillus subluteus]
MQSMLHVLVLLMPFQSNDMSILTLEVEVIHPAAKLLVMALTSSRMSVLLQTMVIILIGELLKKSENLLMMGLHPSESESGDTNSCVPKPSVNSKRTISFHIGTALKPASLALRNKNLKEISDSGIKVIIAGSSISDLALHYLNWFNIAVLKVLSKFGLCRIAYVINATHLTCISAATQGKQATSTS